ncbi:hypothetical protein NL393_27455, partial [Klebsiella pneumoniae]|nr:hypothetical protein [Klebsiella pneumoniae]
MNAIPFSHSATIAWMTFISLLWSIPVFEAKDSRTESAALIMPPYKQFVLLLVLLSQIRKGVKDLSRGLR